MARALRALGPNARAVMEGIRNDNTHPEKYAASVGSEYPHACPCCDATDRLVEAVLGGTMLVRCSSCRTPEIVERPKALRGIAR